MRKHRAKQAAERFLLGRRLRDGDLVFAQVDGSPVDPDIVTKAMRRLARKAALPAGFTFHDLRHSHASMLLKHGIGLRVVSERLGHSAASFTLATYGHVLEGQDREAADRPEVALRAGLGARP